MLRVAAIHSAGHWTQKPDEVTVLNYDDRWRRRVVLQSVRGLKFLLDLQEARRLRGGDALVLDDGRLVEVLAAPELLTEMRCGDQRALVRLAWHLGNRHLPTQIIGPKLRIRRDHVIEEMARGLGADVLHIEAPFDPEGGAYETGGDAHDHGSGHGHSHA